VSHDPNYDPPCRQCGHVATDHPRGTYCGASLSRGRRCHCQGFVGVHLLECQCGHRFQVPAVVPSVWEPCVAAACPVCERTYVGVADGAHGHWEFTRKETP
jgi:hypothetical protein